MKTPFATFITYKRYYLFSLYLCLLYLLYLVLYLCRQIAFMFAINKVVTIATFSAVFVVTACANKTFRSFQVLKKH